MENIQYADDGIYYGRLPEEENVLKGWEEFRACGVEFNKEKSG